MALTFRPRFWPTVMTVVALAILLGLGTWQLDRLQWKTEVLDRIDERVEGAAVSLPGAIADADAWDFRRVEVEGRFLHEHEMMLTSKMHRGDLGYHVLTPLERADGPPVIVDRGWIPIDLRNPDARPETLPEGTVRFEAIARAPEEPGWFKPDNHPERAEWYWYELQAMATEANLDSVAPIYLEVAEGETGTPFPVDGRTIVDIPNNHLHYAFTWYSLAATLLVIYILFHLRRRGPAVSNGRSASAQ